ncbi:ABC transporter permease [Leucobacter ruminantium]|uniref:ABC transporter permease subunit n=1 Tax=Leucobacter ruminantium TaxID=1289170 RepID=A0A939LUY4_9MICO|nr:ABC transporter permease subunit [Leucobacter ruminantium]MBO1804571.1 ABC transporter permease subunit [Leucobacter ruminantium]
MTTETQVIAAQAAQAGRRGRGRGKLGRFAIRLPALVLAILLWQVVATVFDTPFFPPFLDILARFRADWLSGPPSQLFLSDAFITNALPTITRLAAGWLIGVLVGVLIGSLIARLPRVGAALEPLVRFGMSLPAPALLPLAIAFFGLDAGGKIFFIALGAVWPVIVGTAAGLRGADPVAIASARSLTLPAATLFLKVRIPLASPQIMSGLRVSVNAAVLLIIVAELYATTTGIGFMIVNSQRNFDILGTWSGIFLLALLGIVCNGLFVLVERRVMRWQIIPREAQK